MLIISGGWLFYTLFIIENILVFRNYAYYGAYQFGYAQSVPYVNSLLKEKKYDAVIIDTPHAQPHIFYLFFSKYSPREYQNEIKWRAEDYRTNRYNFDFGPFTFRDIYWPTDRNIKNTLFVGNPPSLPSDQLTQTPNATILKEFLTPDGNVDTRIVETK